MFEIVKNTIAKNFNGYIVIVVVTNFRKYFSAQNNSSLQYRYHSIINLMRKPNR